MKKLMFVAAAIAAGVAVADVTSANVVGYMNVKRPTGYPNYCAGSMFLKPGTEKYNLKDLSISFSTTLNKTLARKNFIAFFSDSAAVKVDKDRQYYYYSGDWYHMGLVAAQDVKMTAAQLAEVTIPAGEGFLCSFANDTATIEFPTSL